MLGLINAHTRGGMLPVGWQMTVSRCLAARYMMPVERALYQ